MTEQLLTDVPPRPYPTYDTLSYPNFLSKHLIPNTPFLFASSNTSNWAASSSWRIPTPTRPTVPDLAALRRYAHHVVPVANTLRREYSEFERQERPLGEVLDLWEGVTGAGDHDAGGDSKGDGLYVKDWHLFENIVKEGRSVEEVYTVPECLRDDWMNPPYTPAAPDAPSDRDNGVEESEQLDQGDFRFCYAGPAGTFTPLHKDVYGSYSWSANVVGRKLWWIFRPDQLGKISDGAGDLVFDVRELDGVGGVKILQEEGEIIWIPSGWYHQVLNLDFCISINHNFCASPTLPHLFTALQSAQQRVEESIADILPMIKSRLADGEWEQEWVEEVQSLLERDAGWNWRGFWRMVKRNVQHPPATATLSPPREMRDGFVRDVVERYRRLDEWAILVDVREIVEEVERLLDEKTGG